MMFHSALVVRASSLEPTSGCLSRSSFAGGRGSLLQSPPAWNPISSPRRAPTSAPSVSPQTRGVHMDLPGPPRCPPLSFSRLPDDGKHALLSPWTPSLSPSRQEALDSRLFTAWTTHPPNPYSSPFTFLPKETCGGVYSRRNSKPRVIHSIIVQSLSCVQLFATPWTAAWLASLPTTISQSLLKLMSIELVMPSNQLTLYHPLLLLPSIFPSIRVFPNKLVLRIRWPNYWRFSISPSNEYSGMISFRMDWLDLLAVQGILKSLLRTTI